MPCFYLLALQSIATACNNQRLIQLKLLWLVLLWLIESKFWKLILCPILKCFLVIEYILKFNLDILSVFCLVCPTLGIHYCNVFSRQKSVPPLEVYSLKEQMRSYVLSWASNPRKGVFSENCLIQVLTARAITILKEQYQKSSFRRHILWVF